MNKPKSKTIVVPAKTVTVTCCMDCPYLNSHPHQPSCKKIDDIYEGLWYLLNWHEIDDDIVPRWCPLGLGVEVESDSTPYTIVDENCVEDSTIVDEDWVKDTREKLIKAICDTKNDN